MTHQTRTENTRLLQGRYTSAASKRERSRLVDEYCRMTGLHRKAAIRRLRGRRRRAGGRRGRPRRYGPELVPLVAGLWEIADRPCGVLLAAVLPTLLPALEQHGVLRLRAAQRAAPSRDPCRPDPELFGYALASRGTPECHHGPWVTLFLRHRVGVW